MTRWLLLFFLLCSSAGAAQSTGAFPPRASSGSDSAALPYISREAIPSHPFSVIGPRGALIGQQSGSFEAWIFPWKILDSMRISVTMQDYPLPIEVNRLAAEVRVEPDRTTITYSHANFTIRQIMMAPKKQADWASILVLYQIEAIRPMTLTFEFNPVMQRMWPAQSDDHPSPEWVQDDSLQIGFYILHLNSPAEAAAICLPGAESGIMVPYQESSAPRSLQFVLPFDPAKDTGKDFPLLFSLGQTEQASSKAALALNLTQSRTQVSQSVAANRGYYRNLLRTYTTIQTPDETLNAAFQWAIFAIDQLDVETLPDGKHDALTAGFGPSNDTTRPGFGWFFGRDALWSLYAVDSYGGFSTSRQELQFLASHQRSDGKIMHERSQTANLVDWDKLPYEWASADATPLFLMAANDYFAISGDTSFVKSLWPHLQLAWNFELSHVSQNSGIFNNSAGSAWVESWKPSLPHQEIYLAALDQQASTAFAHMARAVGHGSLAPGAEDRANHIAAAIEKKYYLSAQQNYAFSINEDGTPDTTATIFPSVAWWDGSYSLSNSESMVERWGSSEFSTDWGTRILSDHTSFYDPISYHQGSVWPLFTGWVSVAEYRSGHPLSGYAHLMQNVDLTWSKDLGDVTELLSGEFYQVLGRSTPHQLWSSAMVISPVMRGLFGLEWDVKDDVLTITPQLPAQWQAAALHNVPFGGAALDITIERRGEELRITVTGGPNGLRLKSRTPGAKVLDGTLVLPLAAVEVGIDEALPPFGSVTHQMKVLQEIYGSRKLTIRVSAPAETTETMKIRKNSTSAKLIIDGAQLQEQTSPVGSMQIVFPPGTGYVEKTVTLTW